MDTQRQAPLWEALFAYQQKKMNSWHTPGHKDGVYTWPRWRDFIGEDIFKIDLTEVPGLDNLANPSGVLKKAQEQAAKFFGAARTFFLVNGASIGLMATIMAVCRPGEKIFLPRYAHRSIFNGIILSGTVPIYLETEWLPEIGVPLGVPPSALDKVLKKHPEGKLLIIINPTYEGIVPKSKELIDIAHDNGLKVLIDAAHGSHFGLGPSLPTAPLEEGADFVVQSSHKTLGALTQAAMLHLREDKFTGKIASAINLLQTTSPSYLLMASLDVARLQTEVRGPHDWEKTVDKANMVRKRLASAGIPCLEGRNVVGTAASGIDVTRLVLPTQTFGKSGFEIASILRQAGHEVELAGEAYVLFIITPGDNEDKIESLVTTLINLPRSTKKLQKQTVNLSSCLYRQPQMALTPREAWFSPKSEVPIKDAEGYICAEIISSCPPGLAWLVPGEVIGPKVVDKLMELRGSDGKIMVVSEQV
ncbi:MAG: hypothetical protein PWP31_1761 [Clostridia bacterium]|nr:hypothetical protein [Clostridia bacterium]